MISPIHCRSSSDRRRNPSSIMPPRSLSSSFRPPSANSIRKSLHGYIDGVMNGSIIAGKLVRLCVERHVRDLQEGESRGLWFDETEAIRVIRFFALLSHSKGEWAGRPFLLSGWEQFLLG